MTAIESQLASARLRITQTRVSVLEALTGRDAALSQADLEQAIGEGVDRVTIYRTLKSFLDAGLVHKIPDAAGAPRYALCSTSHCHAEDKHHRHDHIHFKCSTCGETTCLEGAPIPRVALPQGYKVQEVYLVAEGTCAACSQ